MIVVHDWAARQRAHAERAEALVADHERRRGRGHAHPVEDFLFSYYVYRPNQLRRWHAGIGHAIPDASAPHHQWPWYVVRDGSVTVDVTTLGAARSALIEFVRRLMRSTLDRPARNGCFGMHEWAMVYRLGPHKQRHEQWPLRLDSDDVERAVEQSGLRCTHFDAYRFFTPAAIPLNESPLGRETQLATEQPGCLHAGMDLYKWAYKLSPLTPSHLVLDAFELARDIRYVDMQASPYDLGKLGIEPILVETTAGRAQYVERQRSFTARAGPIREQLLEICERTRYSLASIT